MPAAALFSHSSEPVSFHDVVASVAAVGGDAASLSSGRHVVLWWADWSVPARMLHTACDELAGDLRSQSVTFHFVATDDLEAGLRGRVAGRVPLVVFIADGAVVTQFLGARPKPLLREDVLRWCQV